MSRTAVDKAKALHARHLDMDIPVDVETLAEAEGCEVIDYPFLEPVKEVKRGKWIGVARGISPAERRHLIAHALAHHLMHCGNQLAFHRHQQGELSRQEREAEVCAAHILMPGDSLAAVIGLSTSEIAEYFGVPEELASKRVSEYATPEEIEQWREACDEYASI